MRRVTAALLALTACAGLTGCAYPGFYEDGYYDDAYSGSYYGWYDDYYYPGTGYFIYDRGGNRHRWNDHHRRHWEGRREGRDGHEHWAGYDRRDGGRDGRGEGGEWRGRRDGDGQGWRDGRRDGDQQGWRGGGRGGEAATETAGAAPTPLHRGEMKGMSSQSTRLPWLRR